MNMASRSVALLLAVSLVTDPSFAVSMTISGQLLHSEQNINTSVMAEQAVVQTLVLPFRRVFGSPLLRASLFMLIFTTLLYAQRNDTGGGSSWIKWTVGGM